MIIGRCDTTEKVLIIAEIGGNHEGSPALAEDLVGLAAEAGADAVKFQTFNTEHFVNPSDRARVEKLNSMRLSEEDFVRLKEAADRAGVMFISTPLDLKSARFLDPLVPAFKIASGDNTFYPLLETTAGFGKPILLSCGLADLGRLKFSKALIENVWREHGLHPGLAALHCVAAYPVPPGEANLELIRVLARELGCEVGYSDHTLGIEAAVLSVAAGARIVEKHFTIDKNYSDFRDHQLSADPADLAEMVRRIREAEILLGKGQKDLQPSEAALLPVVRRSIIAASDLPAGRILGPGDITWVRGRGGLPPGKEQLVLGRKLSRALTRGEWITLENLE